MGFRARSVTTPDPGRSSPAIDCRLPSRYWAGIGALLIAGVVLVVAVVPGASDGPSGGVAQGDHTPPGAPSAPAITGRPWPEAVVESNAARRPAPIVIYTFDPGGPPRADAKFPDLILYEDGTALSHGDPAGTKPDSTGALYHLGRARASEIVAKLVALGVLKAAGQAEYGPGFDVPHSSLRLRARGRDVMLECQGSGEDRPATTACKALSAVETYLNGVVEGLSQGSPYYPNGYLIEVRRTYQQFSEPRPWNMPGVDLRAVGEGSYGGDFILPPSRRAALLRLAQPYHADYFEDGGVPYAVRWRPLYPHE